MTAAELRVDRAPARATLPKPRSAAKRTLRDEDIVVSRVEPAPRLCAGVLARERPPARRAIVEVELPRAGAATRARDRDG